MRISLFLLAIVLTVPGAAWGQGKTAPLAPARLVSGDPAPAFSLPATGGPGALASYKGRWLVLVFYPKAFAPRDIAEMSSLADVHDELRDLNAAVLGVSMDPPKVVERFHREQNLPFALGSDTDKSVSAAYGALGLKGLFSTRKTVLIDPQGKVAGTIEKVKEKTHGRQVIQVLRDLQAKTAP